MSVWVCAWALRAVAETGDGAGADCFNVDELDDELRDCGSARPVLKGSIFLVIGGALLVFRVGVCFSKTLCLCLGW